jgi:hypothetical protein
MKCKMYAPQVQVSNRKRLFGSRYLECPRCARIRWTPFAKVKTIVRENKRFFSISIDKRASVHYKKKNK